MNDNEIKQYAELIKAVRSATYFYHIKQYYLNAVYIAYIASNRDKQAYIKGYQLKRTAIKSSGSQIIAQMLSGKLIERVQRDLYILTPLSIEVLNYIDSQLSNLESK